MNHDMFREQMELYLHDELAPEERTAFEQHLHDCVACATELEQLRTFVAAVQSHHKPVEVDEHLLEEARQQLRAALRAERSRPTLRERVREQFDWITGGSLQPLREGGSVFSGRGMLAGVTALSAVIVLGAGILIGRTFFAPSAPGIALEPRAAGSHAGESQVGEPPVEAIAVGGGTGSGMPRIMNLQFNTSAQTAAGSGEVDFTFDAVTRVHLKGSINDKRIQAVLAHALVTEENPGVRLRSARMLVPQSEQLSAPDPKIEAALVTALRSDENPAVRREALRVLKGFPFDNEMREAFLYVLMHDRDPGLRIAAINSLDSARVQTREAGPELLNVLREKMRSDDNNYVRIRAKTLLEEASQ